MVRTLNHGYEKPDVDALLSSARAGDQSALGSLFEMYQNYLRLLALSQVGARMKIRASASDIVQETMMQAHRGFDDFRGTTHGEFAAWLRTILCRRIQYLYQQHFKAQRRDVRREVSLQAILRQVDRSTIRLENVLVDDGPSPISKLQNEEQSLRIANALAELPDEYREVLMMRSIETLGFQEIAVRMERSHGAVRMLWLRAIRKLKDQLEQST